MEDVPADVDAYLATVPPAARTTLETLRRIVLTAAPDAVESINYGMPAYKYDGRSLIYFAAAKKHCAIYGTAAGTLRFPHDDPPEDTFVVKLVRDRIADIEAKAKGKRKKRDVPASH